MDPQDVFAQGSLAFCLTQLSGLSRELNDLDAATTYGRRAVVEATPERSQYRRGIAWIALGAASRARGQTTDACRAFRTAKIHLDAAAAAADGPEAFLARNLTRVSQAPAACR
jgi:hypothetical protein